MRLAEVFIYGILGSVTLVWVANFALAATMTGYMSDPQIHFTFIAVVGGSIAVKGVLRRTEVKLP